MTAAAMTAPALTAASAPPAHSAQSRRAAVLEAKGSRFGWLNKGNQKENQG